MIDSESILRRLEEDMHLRGFAESTRNNYGRYAGKFLEYANNHGGMNEETIRKFLRYLLDERKLTPGTVNMYNASIRFLFEVTLDQAISHKRVPRLRERKELPEILTKEELRRIFEHTTPLRNRAVLMTVYGGGLRLSEACELKISDIDSKSMRIFVRNGKGSKDRYTLLSQSNLELLREYWKEYRPRHPEGWLFLDKTGDKHAQKRMVQLALDRALERADIRKEVTVHTLRASFATHLLEDGVDIFTVKRLLGHIGLKSLSRYMGVTKFEASLKSPLDTFPKKRGRKPKAIAHA
jgi:site-specific recombinase XerD